MQISVFVVMRLITRHTLLKCSHCTPWRWSS